MTDPVVTIVETVMAEFDRAVLHTDHVIGFGFVR